MLAKKLNVVEVLATLIVVNVGGPRNAEIFSRRLQQQTNFPTLLQDQFYGLTNLHLAQRRNTFTKAPSPKCEDQESDVHHNCIGKRTPLGGLCGLWIDFEGFQGCLGGFTKNNR